nr:immunoglobulin heavy chain junction region [Macaca mulatta]
CARKNDDLDFW